MAEPVRLQSVESQFDLRAAGRMMLDIMPPWVQDLGLLVEAVESGRPQGAPIDWLPGAVVRLPLSKKLCRDGGIVSAPSLLALVDTAMVFAAAAAWNGYRPMSPVDQTVHYLRPVTFDVLADVRIIRATRTVCFGRIMLMSAVDKRPVAMGSSVYSVQ